MRLLTAIWVLLLTMGARSSVASAKGVICTHVESGTFQVDGLGDDWESLGSTSYGAKAKAGIELTCGYDDAFLYVFANIRDTQLVRTRRGTNKEDLIRVAFGASKKRAMRFTFFPANGRVPAKKSSVPPFVQIADSLQPSGFSVELAVPLVKIPDWSPSVPYLQGLILFSDARRGKKGSVVGLRGKVHFSDAVATYRDFLKTVGATNRDIRLDTLADVDPGKGPERVVIAGRTLGILGTSYSYMHLPVPRVADVLRAKVVDFDGGGRSAIVTELRQFGNGGSRNVVVVWFAQGNGSFQPALTVETRKEKDGNVIENRWSIVPRYKHRSHDGKPRDRGRGRDLLFVVDKVLGFSEETYREIPAPDAKGILTPWGPNQSAVYYFEGTTAYGGEPAKGIK